MAAPINSVGSLIKDYEGFEPSTRCPGESPGHPAEMSTLNSTNDSTNDWDLSKARARAQYQ